MDVEIEASPFHEGEQALQSQYGVRDKLEQMGQSFIRDHMPDQHREFYEQLSYAFVGSIDALGRPWASVLLGQPGFMQSPDEFSLTVNASRVAGDPLSLIHI
ncbi:MAG: hypothetical protein KUG71_08225 [Porticoccaceae bacterium]|nr:hypothetical protein [Porticoccaceae bacterium]